MPPKPSRWKPSRAMFMIRAAQRGVMMLELIISIVIVSAGLAGILSVMDGTLKSSAEPLARKQVMVLAESILEEIVQKEYADTDPGGVPGNETTRITMDDVDDYHGKTQEIFTDWPAALSDFQVAIAVLTADFASARIVPMKKITVTVSGRGHVISLSGYRADY